MQNPELPLTAAEIEAATTEVLGVLGMAFDECEVAPEAPDQLMAGVSIHGPDVIHLTIEVSASVAALAAAMFFGVETGGRSVTDLQDALGELANITAGAIKPLLDGEWAIGIPDRFNPAPISSEAAICVVVPLGPGVATITLAVAASVPSNERSMS